MNPHALAGTSPSSWRVCLFRHSDVYVTGMQRPKIVARGQRPTSAGERASRGRPAPYWPGSDGVVFGMLAGMSIYPKWIVLLSVLAAARMALADPPATEKPKQPAKA